MNYSIGLIVTVTSIKIMKTIFIPTDDDEEFSDDEWGIEENEW